MSAGRHDRRIVLVLGLLLVLISGVFIVALFKNLGSLWAFLPGVVVLTVFLFLTRRYADVGLLMGGLVFVGVGKVLKLLIERPRPDYQIIEPFASGFSFPSGHSLFAVILGGVVVYWVDHLAVEVWI